MENLEKVTPRGTGWPIERYQWAMPVHRSGVQRDSSYYGRTMKRIVSIVMFLSAAWIYHGWLPLVVGEPPLVEAQSFSDGMAKREESSQNTRFQLDRIQRLLDVASMAYQGCVNINLAIQEADLLLDFDPHSAEAYYLLGTGLHMQQRVCYKDTPARHASTPVSAFSSAHGLNPADPRYEKAWVASNPESIEVVRFLEDRVQKDPTDAFAVYMVARRKDTLPQKAIDLLTGAKGCVVGQGTLLGGLLESRGELEKARDAYRMELYGQCEDEDTKWLGTRLSIEGRARFNLARVSLALDDRYESLRQLRLVDFLIMDAALQIVDSEKRDAFADALFAELKKKPLFKREYGNTPREVILALEQAAVVDDAVRFQSLISRDHAVQSYFARKKKGQDSVCEDGSTVCLMRALGELLPEAPTVIQCSDYYKNRARCTIAGRDARDVRLVDLGNKQGSWKLLESRKVE